MLTARLRNQRLTASTLRRASDVVGWLGAMQAQDYIGAKWAIGLRARAVSDADVERAFAEGAILRTHVLRPTWHFVRREDIRWMLALTGPRVQRLNRNYARTLGLDDKLLARARDVISRTLGGTTMTRAELSGVLQKARIEATGQRLAHVLLDLEVQAVICSGPRRGSQFTYALLDDRARRTPELSRDAALTELARRYFQSHGPATIKDFSWWSGLTLREARHATILADVEVLPAPPALQRAPHATYLLPNYDEYLIAYRDRGAVIDSERARNLGVFTSREFPHHVIVDGRLAGSWRRTMTTTAVTIDVSPYRRLSRASAHALTVQAARYSRFLKMPCDVQIA